jgi:hypothetical protein
MASPLAENPAGARTTAEGPELGQRGQWLLEAALADLELQRKSGHFV